MFGEENEQEPELPTDGSGIFARDPGKSDIIQALAEKWGCTIDEACERLGLERPDPTDSIDAADRYGVNVVGCDEESNGEDFENEEVSEEEARANVERIIADVEKHFSDVAIDPVAGTGNSAPVFDHNPIIGEWNGIPVIQSTPEDDAAIRRFARGPM